LPASIAAKPQSQLLTCWKDIARFFGKGVRTVQRWESLGMPVYRPNGDNCVVFADPEELQRWAMSRTNLVAELEKRLSRELSVPERRMIGLAEEILREEAARFDAMDNSPEN
jgi:phage terminase Nu1 subunit (DNA packaging protein)